MDELCEKSLQALDVGGSGGCFFSFFGAISHQYYGTPEFHIAVNDQVLAI